MANPITVECPADVWTLVASAANTGTVHIKDRIPNKYLHTYRVAGDPAPVNLDDAVPFDPMAAISSSFPIDVYIQPVDNDGDVLVALP